MANIIRAQWTTRDYLRTVRHPGHPARTLAGSWISDLATLNKAVLLCESCIPKWNPARYNYRMLDKIAGKTWAMSACDGCKQFGQSKVFLREDFKFR